MSEELQNLLDRIEEEGVRKAEEQADRILSEAGEKAAKITADAGENARSVLARAEQAAAAFEQRARKALDQAARDVVISVRDSIMAALRALALREVSQALTAEALRQMLSVIVEEYFKQGCTTGRLEILLEPEQQQEIVRHFVSRFGEEMREGLEIKADDSIISGFRVSVEDGEVQHDFTDDAIAEAICELLRPGIAEIVKEAMGKQTAP